MQNRKSATICLNEAEIGVMSSVLPRSALLRERALHFSSNSKYLGLSSQHAAKEIYFVCLER